MLRIDIDAFVTSPDIRTALDEAMKHRELVRCKLSLKPGGLAEAGAYYAENPSPALVLLEGGEDPEDVLAQVDRLAEVCQPDTNVLLVGRADSINLYRRLMNRGVGNYLLPPVGGQDIVDAITHIFGGQEARNKGRLISVYGIKGGNGASTIAHNIAWTLADAFKEDVTIVDCDIRFGTAAMDFNLEPKAGLRDLIAQAQNIDPFMVEQYLVEQSEHVRLMAAIPSLRDTQPIPPTVMERMVDILQSMSSFVVLDIPHVWHPWVVDMLTLADETLVVAEPDLASLRNSQLLFDEIGPKRPKERPMRYLLNNVGLDKKGALAAKDFRAALSGNPAAEFPFDTQFRTASVNGQMLGEVAARGKATELMRQLTIALSGREPPPQPKAGVTRFLKARKG